MYERRKPRTSAPHSPGDPMGCTPAAPTPADSCPDARIRIRRPRPPTMNHRDRFLELQALLTAHEALWRPPAFQADLPPWCAERPALTAALLTLDEAVVDDLGHDPDASVRWLAPHLPALTRSTVLCALPPLPARELPERDPRFDAGVPGRKRAQIEAFAAHLPTAALPLLEWCAGKGHLGRRLALADGVPVRSLEIDPTLCADALRLAERSRAPQSVVCADVLDPASRPHLRGHAVLALHACGELHRSLVRSANRDGAPAYAIAPCCYHRGADGGYRPLGRDATLILDTATLRLAVTETVTAPRHDRRRLARDQAWKLGFIALRQTIAGAPGRSFRPVPPAWLNGGFEDFCRRLAEREDLRLPPAVDWAEWAAVGERRRDEVRRLELVRHAFRRALEVWLALDLVLGFETRGFTARLGTFCERALTPRNLLILASRRGVGCVQP
jgi:hypothetical protein